MAARLFVRSLLRRPANARTFAAEVDEAAVHGGHGGGGQMWKILSFTVALPGVFVCYVNAQLKEAEHHKNHVTPEFVAYGHLRLRTKRFPWGDGNHSLFHNRETNPLPDGYEE